MSRVLTLQGRRKLMSADRPPRDPSDLPLDGRRDGEDPTMASGVDRRTLFRLGALAGAGASMAGAGVLAGSAARAQGAGDAGAEATPPEIHAPAEKAPPELHQAPIPPP